jgi:L-lysine epsilon oxidase C-terminal domain
MVEAGEIPEGPDPIYRFAALTKLQYDRFKKWKDGDFNVPEVEPKYPAKIEDVDLSKQPDSLTRAHLESTVGDPLFPGIEMWWLAKLTDTVGLRSTSSKASVTTVPCSTVRFQLQTGSSFQTQPRLGYSPWVSH